MSPVPLKKQGRAGTSTRKRRGEPSERVVEPIMVRVAGGGVVADGLELESLESWTEVIITWGTE